jgi:hypothetical protein
MTGWEPSYEPEMWNKRKEVRETHNCYSYAMNIQDPKQIRRCQEDPNCNVPFHQPGSVSGHPRFSSKRLKTCPELVARILGDNPSIRLGTFEKKCPPHTSSVALAIDADEDYHWYRKDKNGYWSHKPGGTEVTNKDANGALIYNPSLASRNYSGKSSSLNYDTFCTFFCVPRDRTLYLKVGGKSRYKKTRRQPFSRRQPSAKHRRSGATRRSRVQRR